jgi:hypothetical protein
MSIKNNSGITKNVYLLRFADVDPQNAAITGDFNDSFDSSQYSAWGYTPLNYSGPNVAGLGMVIEELGQPNVPYGFEGLNINRADGVDPCNPAALYGGYQAAVDGGIEMLWILTIGPGKTGTVNLRYAQF